MVCDCGAHYSDSLVECPDCDRPNPLCETIDPVEALLGGLRVIPRSAVRLINPIGIALLYESSLDIRYMKFGYGWSVHVTCQYRPHPGEGSGLDFFDALAGAIRSLTLRNP